MEKAREFESLRAGERENSRLRRCAKRVAKRKPTTRACPADKRPKLRLFLSRQLRVLELWWNIFRASRSDGHL